MVPYANRHFRFRLVLQQADLLRSIHAKSKGVGRVRPCQAECELDLAWWKSWPFHPEDPSHVHQPALWSPGVYQRLSSYLWFPENHHIHAPQPNFRQQPNHFPMLARFSFGNELRERRPFWAIDRLMSPFLSDSSKWIFWGAGFCWVTTRVVRWAFRVCACARCISALVLETCSPPDPSCCHFASCFCNCVTTAALLAPFDWQVWRVCNRT